MAGETALYGRSEGRVTDQPSLLDLADGVVDLERGEVRRGTANRPLSPIETKLVAYLASKPGRTVTHAELLEEVWGYRPGVHSRTVQVTIHRLRQKLEVDPAHPVHLFTTRGRGYRFEAAKRSPEAPRAADTFFGRIEELGAIEHAWSRTRAVLLVGPGGVGKTRLAAEHVKDSPHLFCWLSSQVTRSSLVQAVADALELTTGTSVDEISQTVRHAIEARQLMVVLDNLEQLDEEATAQITTWAESLTEGKLLLTTRRSIEIAGAVAIDLGSLQSQDAESLFIARASATGWTAEADDLVSIRTVLAALQHMPLAIELAASRLRLLALPDLLDRLQRHLDLLGPEADKDPRHTSLSAAIAWSWDLLSEEVQHTLTTCSVFGGPFDLNAAEALLASRKTASQLQILQENSLIRRASPTRDGRSRQVLYVSVREFARQKLEEAGQREQTEAAYRSWCLSVGEDIVDRWELSADPEVMAQLDDHIDHLMEARNHALDPVEAARLTACTVDALYNMGTRSPMALPLRTMAKHLERALTAELPDRIALRLEIGLARVNRRLGRAGRTVERLEPLIDRADATSPYCGLDLRDALGSGLARTGRGQEAIAVFEEGIRRYGDLPAALVALIHNDQGNVLASIGQLTDAERHYRMAWDLAVDAEPTYRSTIRNSLANLALRQGRLDDADQWYREALALARETGAHSEGVLLGNLGLVAFAAGRLDEAELAFAEAEMVHQWSGRKRSAALAVGNRARVIHVRGDPEGARPLLERCISLLVGASDRQREAWFRLFLVSVYADLNRVNEARWQLGEYRERIASGFEPAEELEAIANAHIALALQRKGQQAELPELPSSVGSELEPHLRTIRDRIGV